MIDWEQFEILMDMESGKIVALIHKLDLLQRSAGSAPNSQSRVMLRTMRAVLWYRRLDAIRMASPRIEEVPQRSLFQGRH